MLEDPKAPSPHKVLHWQWQHNWAVREGDWKLIATGRGKGQRLFLGSLAGEQPEQKNYATDKPGLVTRLAALHEAFVRDVMPKGNER